MAFDVDEGTAENAVRQALAQATASPAAAPARGAPAAPVVRAYRKARRAPLTQPEELARLIDRYRERATWRDLCQEFNTTPSTISHALRRAGVSVQHRQPFGKAS